MLADERYQKMREVAVSVHPRCESFFVVVHETGHRAASVRQLLWSDVDLESKTVKWRSASDKIGFAHQTPLSEDAAAALAVERRRRTMLNDTWVFPSDRDPSKPLPRHTANKWWRRAEKLAKIEHVEGTGFHSARRKFASEMKSTNLRDLAYLGGGSRRKRFSPSTSSPKWKCSAKHLQEGKSSVSQADSGAIRHLESTPSAQRLRGST